MQWPRSAPAAGHVLLTVFGPELGRVEGEVDVVVAGAGAVVDEVDVGGDAGAGAVEVEGGRAFGGRLLDDRQGGVLESLKVQMTSSPAAMLTETLSPLALGVGAAGAVAEVSVQPAGTFSVTSWPRAGSSRT